MILAAVALAGAALYLPQLSDAPFYLGRDEMFFGLVAQSLSATGHDINGLFLPLYIQSPMRYGSEMWFQPMLMYSAAASVKLFGLDEGTIRLPMALAGVMDIVLVYLIGRRLFAREWTAIAAAVLMTGAPAHFIHSRVAMDFQAALPFMLAWLWCLLTYMERGNTRWLVAAGLSLGFGLYTYIASYMLMPIYAGLTCLVLAQRREPLNRYARLVIGFLVPALLAIPFLWTHPTVLRDVLWHYDRTQAAGSAAGDLFVTYFGVERFLHAGRVYLEFWSPRLLFISGPQGSLWSGGAFLLPTAGLLIVGMFESIRRRPAVAILLIGGLLTAPVPASLAGDFDAVHRASMVLPFGVLLAAFGLNSLWEARARGAVISFIAIWAITIGMIVSHHAQLPLAQAFIRAASVPLILAGLIALHRQRPSPQAGLSQAVIPVLLVLALLQVSYFVAGFTLTVWVSAGALALAAYQFGVRAELAAMAVAVATSHFVAAYPDFSFIRRLGPMPASALVLAARFGYTATALAAIAGVAWLMRDAAKWPVRWITGVAALAIVTVQYAYFHIDYFPQGAGRSAQALLVLLGLAGTAILVGRTGLQRLGPLATVAMVGLAVLQFAPFYADYFTRFRAHAGMFDTEGNGRIVWETAIARAQSQKVPAVYMADVGPYGFADLYWQFYTVKHNRTDLLPLSTAELMFDPERVRNLPDSSFVVTSPSSGTNAAIEQLTAAGALRSRTLLTAPDGRSQFWLLETHRGR